MLRGIPHPIPYQGSKRLLANAILSFVREEVNVFFEPFAGSAAVTLAAAAKGIGRRYLIGDSLQSLIGIWNETLQQPRDLAARYDSIWLAQHANPAEHYLRVREEFNRDKEPAKLLYLLARCVKNAVRFNQYGEFNQSADHRRRGMHPDKMERNLLGAHFILRGKTEAVHADYADLFTMAGEKDLVYLDPPYMGTSTGRDRRYHESLHFERFLTELDLLNSRGVRFLLSFDGRCGTKEYGEAMPAELNLTRVEIEVGRSSQATLNGRDDVTIESLYVSPAFKAGAMNGRMIKLRGNSAQLSIVE